MGVMFMAMMLSASHIFGHVHCIFAFILKVNQNLTEYTLIPGMKFHQVKGPLWS
jgi:hypothetical protein